MMAVTIGGQKKRKVATQLDKLLIFLFITFSRLVYRFHHQGEVDCCEIEVGYMEEEVFDEIIEESNDVDIGKQPEDEIVEEEAVGELNDGELKQSEVDNDMDLDEPIADQEEKDMIGDQPAEDEVIEIHAEEPVVEPIVIENVPPQANTSSSINIKKQEVGNGNRKGMSKGRNKK